MSNVRAWWTNSDGVGHCNGCNSPGEVLNVELSCMTFRLCLACWRKLLAEEKHSWRQLLANAKHAAEQKRKAKP